MRKMPSSVEILDLSANEITKIPQNVFVNAKNLLGFSASIITFFFGPHILKFSMHIW